MEKKPEQKPKISTVRSWFGHNNVSGWVDIYEADPRMSERLVGIEVEVENYDALQMPRSAWLAKEDGSLRNNGMEWVTRPMAAKYARAALTDLLVNALAEECCFSPRTSVHVHVDTLNLEVSKIRLLTVLYSIFEPLLYRFAGRGRNKNIFCVPVLETQLLDIMQGGHSLSVMTQRWEKYSGYNIKPLETLGTVEFRHMHGTRDVDKLTIWIDLLTRMVDYVHATPHDMLETLLQTFGPQVDVTKFMLDVFGPNMIHLGYLDYEDIRGSVNSSKQAFLKPETLHKEYRAKLDRLSPWFMNRINKGLQ